MAAPPTIPPSTDYDSLSTNILKASKIQADLITDNYATLSGGTLTGIVNPVDPQDAVPKSYVTGSIPGGPINSIQYNNNGVFDGSANLLYIGAYSSGAVSLGPTTTLSDNYLNITVNTINNVNEPVNDTDVATKQYIDLIKSFTTVNSISTIASTTYSSTSVISGIILRTNLTTVSDLLPTASDIISQLTNYNVGTGFKFQINNTGTSVINVLPSTGITMSNAVSLYPDYIMACTGVITGPSTVYLNVDNICWSVIYVSNFFNETGFTTYLPYKINGNIFIPGPTAYTEVTTNGYTYTLNDVNKGILTRKPTADSTDLMASFSTNQSFVIQNVSAFTITIQSTGWTFSPSGSIVIAPNKCLYCWIYQGNYLFIIGIVDINGP